MEKLIISLVALLFLFGCNVNVDRKSESSKVKEKQTEIKKTKGLLICSQSRFKDLTIKKGDTLFQKFVFVNKGVEDVEILGYTPSCNCTGLKMSKLIVSPNDSIYAEMIVDTKDKLIGKEKVTATIKTKGERKY